MNKTTDNLTALFKDLQNRLPFGGMIEVAKRAKVSRRTVHNVLAEVSYNQKVVDALIAFVNEYESGEWERKQRAERAAYIASKLKPKKEPQITNA